MEPAATVRTATGTDTGTETDAETDRRTPRRPGPAVAPKVAAAVAAAVCASCLLAGGQGPAHSHAGPHDRVTARTAQGCPPDLIELPVSAPGESASATALNDRGWVVGSLGDPLTSTRAVLWRDQQAPLDLGVGGSSTGRVFRSAVDVNESGVIAIQSAGHPSMGLRPAAFLWSNGTVVRLRGTAHRPQVTVAAVNDLGVAVGSIRGRGRAARPAFWRNGRLHLLPHVKGTEATVDDVNNAGLAVGSTAPVSTFTPTPWWWDTNTRRGGALDVKLGVRLRAGLAASVDERGRIVGNLGPVVTWRDRRGPPRKLFSNARVASSHSSGSLVGSLGGFRGLGARAWTAHLSDSRPTVLPDPVLDDPDSWIANIVGQDVARGTSPYAPHGGVTVAGTVMLDSEPSRAFLWTCAQTY